MTDRPVSIVTGGARGIGRAISTALAAAGHAVVVNYAHSRSAADETVAAIESAGGLAFAAQADVAKADDRSNLVKLALSEFGRLDVLVNNAGITSPGRLDLLDATEESWDQVFDTNLKGPFFLAQSAARGMIELIAAEKIPNGKIVNISSISAFAVSRNRGDYCMTKAAMQMMTWLLAERLAEEKIQVFEICPGVIASDMTAPVKEKYDRLLSEGLAPQRRWGQGDDVAKAVLAIVDDCFPYSTGQRFYVDGGFHIRRL